MSKHDPSRLSTTISTAINTMIAAPIQAHQSMHGRLQLSAAALIPNLIKNQSIQITNIKTNRNALVDLHDSLIVAEQLDREMRACVSRQSHALERVLAELD